LPDFIADVRDIGNAPVKTVRISGNGKIKDKISCSPSNSYIKLFNFSTWDLGDTKPAQYVVWTFGNICKKQIHGFFNRRTCGMKPIGNDGFF
jgi:hypothetical protein